jgi:threonine dehydratase
MASAADRWAEPRVHTEGNLPISLEALRAAARGLVGIAVQTPLQHFPAVTSLKGFPVALKCEQYQPTGSFKIRGAYTAISRLPAEARARGVITYSSGNHGQAVAFAAQRLGVRAVVVMPHTAPEIKVEGVRRHGGEVMLEGTTSAERWERARQVAEQDGLAMVPPFESLDVITGQGTCGLEIVEQFPQAETILVPVGGGGLIAGIAAAAAALSSAVQIVGVEPAGAATLNAALDRGRPVKLDHTDSIADGLLPLSIGELPFQVLSGLVRTSVQVREDEIVAALRFLSQEAGLVVEPSGAVTTAALLSGRFRSSGPTVAVVSGGNVDAALLQRLVKPPRPRK